MVENSERARVVLITGASGGVGRFLRAGLPELGWTLRLLDRAPFPALESAGDEEQIIGDITDPAALDRAMQGVDAVIHLAGISVEAPFPDILEANINGTYQVFEAARRNGVARVVYASSNHAVGFYPSSGLAPTDAQTRPDTYYGTSKAFGEALGCLYTDKFGVEVISVRIGSCFAVPKDARQLATWLSPADAVRLMHACLTGPVDEPAIVYGISANTRGYWDLTSARALGYEPQDNAEDYAADLPGGAGAVDTSEFLGGAFCTATPPTVVPTA